MIQVLPEAKAEILDKLEKNIKSAAGISQLMQQGYNIEEIMNKILLQDFQPIELERIEPSFKCDCSAERLSDILVSLGEKELQDIIEKQDEAELVCHFCNTNYQFNREYIQDLIATIKKN